jgi:metal-sulfur cluster biosynthetic enzyme
MTTRACPLGEMILEEARAALAARFPDVPQISVALVWEPPWSREMMTTRGQELLGM